MGTEETAPSKKLNHPSCKPTEPSLLNKEGKLHDGLPEALQHSRAGSKPRAGNKCSTQPPGHMTWSNYSQSLPGYDSTGTVAVTFAFYDGVQGEEHPHPGQPYKGTTLIVYLPNTSEGKQVLRLFRKVFDARLLFTVGCNHHRVDEIDWNGVRPKLCVNRTRFVFQCVCCSRCLCFGLCWCFSAFVFKITARLMFVFVCFLVCLFICLVV